MDWNKLHRAIPRTDGLTILIALWFAYSLSWPTAQAFPKNDPLIDYVHTCIDKHRDQVTPSAAVDLERFKVEYLHSFSRNADNAQFISEVLPVPKKGALFYHVDNVLLKTLSEIYFQDRELVAATEGLFTSILFDNLGRNKKLMANLVYSDYKTTRLGFGVDTPALRKELARLHDETAREFGHMMWHNESLHSFYKHGPGAVANPEMWHLAGVGKTPDQASTVARYGRFLFKELDAAGKKHVPLLDFDNEHIKQELVERFDLVEESRAELQKSLENGGPEFRAMLSYSGGRAVLNRKAVEILRRLQAVESNADYFDLLKQAFSARFDGVQLSASMLARLQSYAHAIDTFMPSIYEANEVMDFGFSKAQHGSVMFDVAGQNARNIVQAMKAMATIAKRHGKQDNRLEIAIAEARRGQQQASLEFEKRRNRVRDVIARLGFNPADVLFSGDDGIYLPDRVLSDEQKKGVLKALREMGGSGEYRVTFLPSHYFDNGHPIPPPERSAIVSSAEQIEKKARIKLELSSIPYRDLQQMLFAVDIDPASDGGRKVRLFVSGALDSRAIETIRSTVKAMLPTGVVLEDVIPTDATPPPGMRRPNHLDLSDSPRGSRPLPLPPFSQLDRPYFGWASV